MVKVLSSFVRGPLEPYVTGFAEDLLRQGYSRSSAGQHVCFIAHLDRWMQAEGRCWVGAGEGSSPRGVARMASASSVKIASSRRPGSTSSSSS